MCYHYSTLLYDDDGKIPQPTVAAVFLFFFDVCSHPDLLEYTN